MKHLLIVDDEHGARQSLKAVFKPEYRVSLASGAREAAALLAAERVDAVLLDVIMPDKDGIEFLREIRSRYPDLPVVMISAASSVRRVVEAMREGASDYVSKPFDVDEVRFIVKRAIENSRLQRHLEVLESQVAGAFPLEEVVGSSPAFLNTLTDARKAAATDATILIIGESGTGKELIARLIHSLSPRHEEPFVPVHCAAIPDTLMESELFGHEKGAFTGAQQRKPGRFDLAGSGTIFFDEVGEMSPSTQVKLLRVLQEREFMRVGGTNIVRTNARILAATARNLREMVKEGTFRDDLYYRLSVVPVFLPPLRERPEDIPLLVNHFLEQFRHSTGAATREVAPETLELLRKYPWPGNIRELRNIIERLLVLHHEEAVIRPEFLPEEFHTHDLFGPLKAGTFTLEEAVNEFERQLVEDALRRAGGVQTRAAEILGTTRRILRYRMEKLNISPETYKNS